jgi:hypothetical protein
MKNLRARKIVIITGVLTGAFIYGVYGTRLLKELFFVNTIARVEFAGLFLFAFYLGKTNEKK